MCRGLDVRGAIHLDRWTQYCTIHIPASGAHASIPRFIVWPFSLGPKLPHQGSDRLLGRVGCPIQRKLTIEGARPSRTIWSFHLLKVSVKIDPKHPHLLIEWPARSQRLWRFRVGYRWDANAKAYIFPFLALKRVDGPMHEYQTDSQRRPKPT
jgi:hypothetical protein